MVLEHDGGQEGEGESAGARVRVVDGEGGEEVSQPLHMEADIALGVGL